MRMGVVVETSAIAVAETGMVDAGIVKVAEIGAIAMTETRMADAGVAGMAETSVIGVVGEVVIGIPISAATSGSLKVSAIRRMNILSKRKPQQEGDTSIYMKKR